MIDTVVVKFRTEVPPDKLDCGWATSEYHNPKKKNESQKKHMLNQGKFKATYYPCARHIHAPLLLLEFSLPKVLYGTNWPMLVDLQAAIAKADEFIAGNPALPDLPSVGDADLVRLDACYNHSVGDDIHAYLQALSRLEYRSRQTVPFLGTGVEYRAVSAKTKFYDKLAEAIALYPGVPEWWPPPGTLRQETTLRKSRETAAALRSTRVATLNRLTLEMVLDILWRDLKHLGIVDCQFATSNLALETVCEHFGSNKGLRSYGALCAFQDRQKSRVAFEMGTLRHNVNRLLREISRLGIAPAIIEGQPLPPLEIRWPPPKDQVPEAFYSATEGMEY